MKILATLALALAASATMADELADALKLKGDAARGRAAFQPCERCHGADAGGRPDGAYPVLAGQFSPVLVKQMADIRAHKRENANRTMRRELRGYSDADVEAVADHVSRLASPAAANR